MTKVFEKDPVQEAVIEKFSTTRSGGALNGSGTGVGKTYIAVKTAKNRGMKRGLFIAPVNTFDNWEASLLSVMGEQLRPCANKAIGPHSKAECQANMAAAQAGEDGLFFVGREMFNLQNWAEVHNRDGSVKRTDKGKPVMRRLDIWSKKRVYDMAIFDEVQLCSDAGSRTRQSWAHLGVKPAEDGGLKLAQSADFFGSKLENIYTITEDLWPGNAGMNRAEWTDEYFETEYDHYAFTKKKVVGEKWEGFYVSTLPCYAAIPSPIEKPEPEPRYIDLSAAQRKLYNQLEDDLAAEIEGNTLIIDMDMALTMRLRELTLGMFHVVEGVRPNKETGEPESFTTIDYRPGDPSSTVDTIKEIQREHGGEPMLVLTHSKKFAIKAAADLGGLPYTGDQGDAERREAERAFRAGEVSILVGTTAICEGLDGLQDTCRLSVIASRPWTPYKLEQFLGRTARRGQKKPVLAYEIIRRGTIDVGVRGRLLAQTLMLNKAKAMEVRA